MGRKEKSMYTRYEMIQGVDKGAHMTAARHSRSIGSESQKEKRLGLHRRVLRSVILGALLLGGTFAGGFLSDGVRANDIGSVDQKQYVIFSHGLNGVPMASAAYVGKSQSVGGKTYIGQAVEGAKDGKIKYFWVREGYVARIRQEKRFNGAKSGDRIEVYKKDVAADSGELLMAYNAEQKAQPGNTHNAGELQHVRAAAFAGTASGQAIVRMHDPAIEIHGKGGEASPYFKELSPDPLTGIYSYEGEALGVSDLYVIDGNKVGIYVVDGKRYKGDLYGFNNEILKTAIGSDNKYYSYWAAEVYDPKQTIGQMTVKDFNEKILAPLTDNDYKLHQNDIKEIHVRNDGANGGIVSLQTNGAFNADGTAIGGAWIPGSMRIANTETGGKEGQDVRIQFSNEKGAFTVDAGSKVSAVTKAGAEKTMEGLMINGETYAFPTGSASDFHLVNGKDTIQGAAGSGSAVLGYQVNDDGMVELTVQNGENEHTGKTVVIGNLASKTAVDTLESQTLKYDRNPDGSVNYGSITAGGGTGPTYDSGKKTGGTRITNVAYADGTDGSAAVNMDRLNDSIRAAVQEGQEADQHVKAGTYAVTTIQADDHTTVQGVSLDIVNNKGTRTGHVRITDVAKASDVGNVNDFHEGLKGEHGAPTTVVGAVNRIDDKVGNLNYGQDHTDPAIVSRGDNVTVAIGKLDQAVAEAKHMAGKRSAVSAGQGIIVNPVTRTAGDDYQVSLADDFTLGGKDGQGSLAVKGSKGAVEASGTMTAGAFQTGSVSVNAEGNGLISGLHNTEWHRALLEKTAAEGGYSGSSRAATESQLRQAIRGAIQYDRDENGNIDPTRITLNSGNTPVTINNLKEGNVEKDSKEAVNGGQLWETRKQLEENQAGLSEVRGSISRLGNRVDRVGAGAAALAALQPLDFDPDAKWDFSAGYGNYNGANAMAVGAYYRPNEDLLFSVGTSLGGGENMVNAGISVKLGSGSSHVTTSRTAMAKEIVSLREQVEKLTELVNQLAGQRKQEQGPSGIFTGVPENH